MENSLFVVIAAIVIMTGFMFVYCRPLGGIFAWPGQLSISAIVPTLVGTARACLTVVDADRRRSFGRQWGTVRYRAGIRGRDRLTRILLAPAAPRGARRRHVSSVLDAIVGAFSFGITVGDGNVTGWHTKDGRPRMDRTHTLFAVFTRTGVSLEAGKGVAW